jgi:bla regulator protein blaR1
MITSLLILAAIKATLLSQGAWAAVQALPPCWIHARRRTAIIGVWSVLVLPWLSLPVAAPMAIALPVKQVGAAAWMWCWGLGSAVMLLRLVVEARTIKHACARAVPIAMHDGVPMLRCKGLRSACLVGWWRPRVLVPWRALRWPSPQMRAAVQHELQHAAQYDGLHRPVAAVVRALFWWNPLVALLCRRAEIESELCCDAAASAALGQRAYGAMLLAMATRTPLAMLPAWSSQPAIKERLQRLLLVAPQGSALGCFLRAGAALMIAAVMGSIVCSLQGADALAAEAALRLSADAFPAGE